MIRPIKKVLVANRGEIAARIMRTCRRLGIETVAVYSEADRNSPHVLLADQAICIGPPPSRDSYLAMDKIIAAAKNCGADAIHPGYGFLSENDQFALAVEEAGIIFIGPSPESIRMMGNKLAAKKAAKDFNIPMVPGTETALSDMKEAIAVASGLGYPLLIKAAAGGGGKGMRIVNQADELEPQVERAMSEALASFGDGSVFIEKYVTSPRHIEIQVMADKHGHCLHFFERECSIQRRHQKIIEEAPSSILTPEKRNRMGQDAIMVARSCNYTGAGTVEFLMDENNHHYFLEMNTRLQVEHPVTEMVTGLDLVEWQLRVAAGQPLPLAQAEVRLSGHAIEARLYAEDPYAGFAPQTGTVRRWRPQHALHAGVRIDAGIEEGSEVSPWYDPMVAKVIAHGRDRDDAIRRLRAALQNTPLLGLRNNGRFLADLVDHPAFRNAAMTTTLIDQWQEAGEPLLQRPVPGDDLWCLAAATFALQDGPGWRANSVAAYGIPLQCEDSSHTLRVQPDRTGLVRVELGTQRHEVRIFGFDDGALRYEMDGVRRQALACIHESELHLAVAGSVHVFREVSAFPNRDAAQDATRARAPVAGKVTQVQVAVGDAVALGQALVCVEAMKMEMWLSAQAAGRVTVVHAQAGDQVESGALLVEIELENNPET